MRTPQSHPLHASTRAPGTAVYSPSSRASAAATHVGCAPDAAESAAGAGPDHGWNRTPAPTVSPASSRGRMGYMPRSNSGVYGFNSVTFPCSATRPGPPAWSSPRSISRSRLSQICRLRSRPALRSRDSASCSRWIWRSTRTSRSWPKFAGGPIPGPDPPRRARDGRKEPSGHRQPPRCRRRRVTWHGRSEAQEPCLLLDTVTTVAFPKLAHAPSLARRTDSLDGGGHSHQHQR